MNIPTLCAPAYELGEYADLVSELPELETAPQIAAELMAPNAGFVTYRWSDASVVELMAVAVRRTLVGAGVRGDEIDMVLLATDSLPADRSAHHDVAELLDEAGMTGATVVTVGLMDCATAMVALGTAASLVRDGTARNVMVLSGDLADHSTGGQRVVAGGAAIASDGAASALVSASAPGLPLLAMAHHAAPEHEEEGGSPQRRLTSRMNAYRDLFDRLSARHPIRPSETLVLPSNFARNVMRMYLGHIGFSTERIALDGVGRIAHCQGSDPLINLADRLAEPKPAESVGDPDALVLLGAGISHLAAVLLDAKPLSAREGSS
jgi:3-oxoacyl-[acyl-carrier-protein] synthase-3